MRAVVPNVGKLRDHLRLILAPLALAQALVVMAGWTDGEEQDILEDWFSGTARPLAPTHIGLFTTTPADDATGGVEPTWTGYARVAFARNGTNWGSSTAGAPSTIQNLVTVTFAEDTSGSGTVLSWGYFTAITSGTLLFFAVLSASLAIGVGDTPQFNVGDMVPKLGDPGDAY